MKASNPVKKQVKSTQDIIAANIKVSKLFMTLTSASILLYFSWWLNFNNAGNPMLYGLLVIGEIYHVWQAFGYIYTVWDQRKPQVKILRRKRNQPQVDIFITVCGEPVEVVEKTLTAATSLTYTNYKVYVLNDGKSRNLSGWKKIDALALNYGAIPISRAINKGAKAGNINNGMNQTSAPLFAVFDADHIPHKDFLIRTVAYFDDPKMAIVQTPQYYANADNSFLTRAASEQQELFFGPICRGKNRMNATFWCGTNAVIRRAALESINGIPEDNIAEDFLASLKMHEQGWKSVYIPRVLAEGLSPHNLGNYALQQFRWARGSSEIMFNHNPIFKRGLTLGQKIQYLYSSSYYLNGFVVLLDALIPVIVLFSGVSPVKANTSDFMLYFFPFIFSTLHLLMISTDNTITYRAAQLSVGSFFIFIKAILASVIGIKANFKVTSKAEESGNFLYLAIPHLTYIAVALSAVVYGIAKYGLVPSVLTNTSWILFNIAFFFSFIRASYPWAKAIKKLLLKLLAIKAAFGVVVPTTPAKAVATAIETPKKGVKYEKS